MKVRVLTVCRCKMHRPTPPLHHRLANRLPVSSPFSVPLRTTISLHPGQIVASFSPTPFHSSHGSAPSPVSARRNWRFCSESTLPTQTISALPPQARLDRLRSESGCDTSRTSRVRVGGTHIYTLALAFGEGAVFLFLCIPRTFGAVHAVLHSLPPSL
ncbi:hypothetical protein C8R45DRAFT_1032824, partial [Mycena sanguinolenta]